VIALAAAGPVRADEALLERLAGLRLVDKADKLLPPEQLHPGLDIEGARLLNGPDVRAKLNGFIGKPFSKDSITAVTRTITDWYRARHHPFVDVSFPSQDIAGGVVQVVVMEFRLGKVRVAGNRWFSGRLLTRGISLKPGETIDEKVLDQDIARLNQNAYLQVTAVADKSSDPGRTDITLQTVDRFPWRFSAGLDNGDPVTLGRERWSFAADWGNAFGLGQDISYQLTSSDDFWFRPTHLPVGPGGATMMDNQANWTIPLPWHDRITIFGDYGQQFPNLGAFFTQVGVNMQVGGRYVVSLPEHGSFKHELQFGFDFKRTNSNLAFGGDQVASQYTEIDQFPVVYSASLDDGMGPLGLTNQLIFSPGGLTGRNNDAAFQPSATQSGVFDAKANYIYDDINISQLIRLPRNFAGLLRVQGQVATSNLLSSEELGLGGIDSVRGYDARTASGSLGLTASAEIRFPAISVLDRFLASKTGDQLQADIFGDFGYVGQKTPMPGVKDQTYLESVGGGLHYSIGRYLEARFEYGWQLRSAPGASHHTGQALFSVLVYH